MSHKHLCLLCGDVIEEGDFDCEVDADHDFAVCIKHLDVDVTLKCGCEEIWHDPADLQIGVYYFCKCHGDTEVVSIP